jgi:hypothetical protein
MFETLDQMLAGQYTTERRMLLNAEVIRDDESVFGSFGIQRCRAVSRHEQRHDRV